MKKEIEALIDKSERAIKSAKREFQAGEYDYACSRAYYSAFYMIEGVLLLDGKRFTKHSTVISVFNRDYVKTGIFPVRDRGSHNVLHSSKNLQYSRGGKGDRSEARRFISGEQQGATS